MLKKRRKIIRDLKECRDQELGIMAVLQGKLEISSQNAILNIRFKYSQTVNMSLFRFSTILIYKLKTQKMQKKKQ